MVDIVCNTKRHISINKTMSEDRLKLWFWERDTGGKDTYFTLKEGRKLQEALTKLLE